MSGAIALRPAGSGHEIRGRDGVSFVAIKTATIRNEYGTEETVTAGVTHVHDGRHFLVTKYPHLFAREGARTRARAAPRRRTATSPPSTTAPRSAPQWKPLVRLDTRAAPTVTVAITRRAYLEMTDQAFGQRGEVETGGALFGIPAKDGAPKIRRAGSPGPKARASRSSMRPDLEHTRREAGELERNGGLDRWVGSWHTHPSADGLPSDNDVCFFAWDCRELHHMGRSMDNLGAEVAAQPSVDRGLGPAQVAVVVAALPVGGEDQPDVLGGRVVPLPRRRGAPSGHTKAARAAMTPTRRERDVKAQDRQAERQLPKVDAAEDHHTLTPEVAEAAEALTLTERFYQGRGVRFVCTGARGTAPSPKIPPQAEGEILTGGVS
jgi:proteasome lid subunit RPN8/RPN11